MPRPRRVHIEEGALYLVSSKAAGNKRIFEDREDFEAYLELLEQYRMKFGFRLFAYTLLPSELHLCMQMKDGATVSSVMHALNSRYTKFYMKRHGRTDHLFEGRFKSTLMEKELYLLRMTGYLHSLVERAEGENANHPLTLALSPGWRGKEKEYPWSSYRHYQQQGTVPPPQSVHHQTAGGRPAEVFVADVGGQASGDSPLEIHSEIQEVLKALRLEWPGISYEDYLRSVPNFRWEEFGKELEEQALGSQSFLNLVERKAKGQVTVTQGDSHHDPKEPQPRPDPMPMPIKRTGSLHSVALMVSVLATCLALGAVGLTLRALVGTVTPPQSVGGQAEDSSRGQIAAGPRSQLQSPGPVGHSLANFAMPSGLDGTSWEVRMKPMYATGNGQAQQDEIEFRGSRIASAKLMAEGFSDSKYTVTQKPNGILRWETMQRGPGGERVFWRGEWDGKTMRGVVSRQVPGSGPLDFSFVGMKGESQETGRTL